MGPRRSSGWPGGADATTRTIRRPERSETPTRPSAARQHETWRRIRAIPPEPGPQKPDECGAQSPKHHEQYWRPGSLEGPHQTKRKRPEERQRRLHRHDRAQRGTKEGRLAAPDITMSPGRQMHEAKAPPNQHRTTRRRRAAARTTTRPQYGSHAKGDRRAAHSTRKDGAPIHEEHPNAEGRRKGAAATRTRASRASEHTGVTSGSEAATHPDARRGPEPDLSAAEYRSEGPRSHEGRSARRQIEHAATTQHPPALPRHCAAPLEHDESNTPMPRDR
jgi:hypothetical protein